MPSFQSEIDEVKKIAVSVVINRVVKMIDTRQGRRCSAVVREFPDMTISLDPEGSGCQKRGRVQSLKASLLDNISMPVQYCNSIILNEIYSYIRYQKHLVELCTPYVLVRNFLRQIPWV